MSTQKRLIYIIFMLFVTAHAYSGEQTVTRIELDKDITIAFTVEKFIKTENKISGCGGGYICLVNNKPLWGTDGKLPRTILRKLYIDIKERKIELNTAGMFNPMVSDSEKTRYQVVNYYDDVWKVRGRFSDGAATYHAEWLVANGHAIRVMIGDGELLHDAFKHVFKNK